MLGKEFFSLFFSLRQKKHGRVIRLLHFRACRAPLTDEEYHNGDAADDGEDDGNLYRKYPQAYMRVRAFWKTKEEDTGSEYAWELAHLHIIIRPVLVPQPRNRGAHVQDRSTTMHIAAVVRNMTGIWMLKMNKMMP